MSEPSFSFAPDVQHWVETRLADGDYASLAEYLNELVRRDRVEREELRALIADGVASGIDPRDPHDIFEEIRNEDPDFRV